MKKCPRCKIIKKAVKFSKNKSRVDGLNSYCIVCMTKNNRQYYKKYPDKAKNVWYKHKYGITFSEVTDRLNSQGGLCAICDANITGKDTLNRTIAHLDHDHKTGVFRGMLCLSCNRGIGSFFDNPDLLIVASNYLKQYAKS